MIKNFLVLKLIFNFHFSSAQKSYRAPFIFAQFDIPANTLVNIECKAFAKNIDNADRLNRRGMTKFSILVSNKKE